MFQASKLKITSSFGVHTVSPIKDNQHSTVSELRSDKKTEDRSVLRTYLVNCTQRETLDETALPDSYQKKGERETQPAAIIECSYGQQPAIIKIQIYNAMLKVQNGKLKQALQESNKRCLTLTDSLN